MNKEKRAIIIVSGRDEFSWHKDDLYSLKAWDNGPVQKDVQALLDSLWEQGYERILAIVPLARQSGSGEVLRSILNRDGRFISEVRNVNAGEAGCRLYGRWIMEQLADLPWEQMIHMVDMTRKTGRRIMLLENKGRAGGYMAGNVSAKGKVTRERWFRSLTDALSWITRLVGRYYIRYGQELCADVSGQNEAVVIYIKDQLADMGIGAKSSEASEMFLEITLFAPKKGNK